MDISPTSVAAVICQALSPELSHDAYGITVFAPPAPATPRASTQRFMFPMDGFRRHFPFVTPAVTRQVVKQGIFRECVVTPLTSARAGRSPGAITAASHCCNVGGTQP